ncbi:PhosphoesteraseDHH family protein [Oenococcus kitaharae DSM 17330]|uniref:PhosphoesteraseDHH family protein n=2 Tax=Lactobacillaceae TaxID=33958 RepID=G9WF12_9LACO|nr:PhosphoesteraseDHH family protein [Oenococcus kitaharae DSM 17330]
MFLKKGLKFLDRDKIRFLMKKYSNLPAFIKNYRVIYLIGIFLLLAISGFVFSLRFGPIISVIWVAFVILAALLLYSLISSLGVDFQTYMTNLYGRVSISQTSALDQMPIGVMLLNSNGEIEWVNENLLNVIGDRSVIGKNIKDADPELNQFVQANKDSGPAEISWRDGKFSLQVQGNGRAIFLLDLTDVSKYELLYQNDRLFYGLINVDNYEEVIQDATDSDSSRLIAFISGRLDNWAKKYHLFLRRISADRYLFFGRLPNLKQLEDDRFSILDEIREESLKQNMPLSLSVGIAYGISDLNNLADLAHRNLDLALGRGGDQVVIRDNENPAIYYGGTSNPMAKRTRVRARMIDQALSDLLNNTDVVFICGHQNPDMDSLGAALGIWRMSRLHDLPAYIVIDEQNLQRDVKLVTTKFSEEIAAANAKIKEQAAASDDNQPPKLIEYPFISEKKAMALASDQSLLVLVDHSRPTISAAGQLLDRLKSSLVVIDHHRIADEGFAEKPLLFYVEQYASSTSELVTELLGYEDRRKSPLTKVEATALLGGIQLDTKGFTAHSGSRTFDAASFLRAAGADTQLLRSFGKESKEDLLVKAHLLELTDLNENIATVVGENEIDYNSVLAAQVADELLKIQGASASFVITRRPDKKVGVSARSDGSVNVQLIMEKIGGGGSLSNAAAQIETDNIVEVKQQLEKVIFDSSDEKK